MLVHGKVTTCHWLEGRLVEVTIRLHAPTEYDPWGRGESPINREATVQLPDPPKSPGHLAYEAFHPTCAIPWMQLLGRDRDRWETAAKAAREAK